MIYLLDASALITAHNTYYGRHRVPEFWSWVRHHGATGSLKMPDEVFAEVRDGTDDLAKWMTTDDTKAALLLQEETDFDHLQTVLACYGDDLSEADMVRIGRDPFLIAAALADPQGRCVVTAEVYKQTKTGANRHVPNVCADVGVAWITPVDLLDALDFTTGWDD
jgi:hypothetical protein